MPPTRHLVQPTSQLPRKARHRVTQFTRVVCAGLLAFSAALRAALPKADTPHENSLGMKFVPVAGAKVLVSVYETRVKDFAAFADATGFKTDRKMYTWIDRSGKPREGYDWREPGMTQGPTHPVGGVSWNDAEAFCGWLTKKERAAGLIGPNQTYRLPTDEEWSIAAGMPKEGGATPSERDKKIKDLYPWGTDWPPRTGNYGDVNFVQPTDAHYPKQGNPLKEYNDGSQYAAPVGTYKPNAFGLYDMGGNVYEWVADQYGGNTPRATHRVMRGGGFNSNSQSMLLSSNRITFEATDRSGNHGFRCVLETNTPGK